MGSRPDRPTRFAADLLDSAAEEGARQSRSAKQLLDHWARVGRAVAMPHTAPPAAGGSFGRTHLAKGFATVALDENGTLLRYAPDGSVTPRPTLTTPPASQLRPVTRSSPIITR